MKITSQHVSFNKLADLAEERGSAAEQSAAREHIASCSRCAEQFQSVSQVIELMRTDSARDAPRDVIANTVGVFGPRARSRKKSLPRRMIGALSFDSNMNSTPVFGVRSVQGMSRQLLYSAAENDIDLHISPAKENWIIAGQVLGPACEGGRIEIEGKGKSATAILNDLCEFTLPAVPSGNYTLRLRLRDTEVEIPELELRG